LVVYITHAASHNKSIDLLTWFKSSFGKKRALCDFFDLL